MVLVCTHPGFVFLKTRKTAGTSVEMALQTYCMPPNQEIVEYAPEMSSRYGIVGARGTYVKSSVPRWKFWQKYPWNNHMPAIKVRENLGKRRFVSLAKITTIREPLDWMVSMFHQFNRVECEKISEFAEMREAFRSYVLSSKWRSDFGIVSIDGRLVIDYFIRKEHLREDLNKVADALGLDCSRLELPHTKDNAAMRNGREPIEYFDVETLDAVRKRAAWLFDNFDYQNRPLPPQEPTVPAVTETSEQR